MELHIQPRAPACAVSGQPFTPGARVTSFLVRAADGAILRHDVLEAHAGGFSADAPILCRWVQVFRARDRDSDGAAALRLTAENLFLTLADPSVEQAPENGRLLRFLALMLERKRILRPRGRTADGLREVFEHAKTKQVFEVPALVMDDAFFAGVGPLLGALIPDIPAPAPAAPAGGSPAG